MEQIDDNLNLYILHSICTVCECVCAWLLYIHMYVRGCVSVCAHMYVLSYEQGGGVLMRMRILFLNGADVIH